MKYILFITALLAVLAGGCEADQVGYLNSGHMRYDPDTIRFKCVLDPENPEDARILKYNFPLQSGGLQGVDASLPLDYRIVGIECEETNREAAKQFYMTEIEARLALPCRHSVPPGAYTFTMEYWNEGGRNKVVLYRALTVIME